MRAQLSNLTRQIYKFALAVESFVYQFRDFLWMYPDLILTGDQPLWLKLRNYYNLSRPYSHMFSALIVIIMVIYLAFNPAVLKAGGYTNVLIEGVVMGVNENNEIQSIDTLTPLLAPRFQLNADLQNLIYEPLLRVNSDGGVIFKLAKNIAATVNESGEKLDGISYDISLRSNVLWHDGTRFTADDVIATFNKIVELASPDLGENRVLANRAEALLQMSASKIDDFNLRLSLKGTGTEGVKKLLPNFLELITFKIMPAKYLAEINPLSVVSSDASINRKPIGTGPFKFESSTNTRIVLSRFSNYYEPFLGNLDGIQFSLFKTEDALITSLKNGKIHSFVSNTARHVRDLERYPQILQYRSGVLKNQYWAVYFNTQSTVAYLKDPKVRSALAQAVNYDLLLKSILSRGEKAFGPIPSSSPYFSQTASWPKYDKEAAVNSLKQQGWAYNAAQKLVKDGEPLLINIKYVDNFDRAQVIESLKQDWESIGVTVVAESYPLSEFKGEVLLGSYDVILYGMSTFIDPDRYELFHSSAIKAPGLNLARYQSAEQVRTIIDRKVVQISRTDRALEVGRSTLDFNLRKAEYDELQGYLAQDQPVIFLYHPLYGYYANSTLTGVDLTSVASIEERFNSITSWLLN